ncbi:hypothetical protein FQN53_000410 [Emmonsiellopsis sp. PD_33]|nr:hypothetical protein FQN53_000410 [Emmonsiellopsis sp. PD_33]
MTPSPSSCPTPIPTPTPTPTLLLTPLSSIRDKQTALTILSHLNRLEKKTFPASEAFDFSDPNLWRKKPNTRILYATSPTTTPTNTNNNNNNIIAYAVYVRLRDTALLHKVCVAEGHRGKGVGRELMRQVVEERVGKGERGCRVVQLWVDEGRGVARRLYRGCGFEEVEWVRGYYGAGRGGVRMVREMGGVMG